MNDLPDDELTKTLRETLDRSTRELDEATLQRLRDGRRAAVAVVAQAQRRRPAAWWLPAGAFAMAALAVVAFSLWNGRAGGGSPGLHGEPTVAAIEDIDVLAAGDDVAIAEDVEFYQWLALVDEAG